MSTLKRFTLIVTLVILTACSATPASPLVANRQKWESQRISHYRFHLSLICFCAFRDQMPLTIEVRDGQVVSMLNSQGNPASPDLQEIAEKFSTIDKLFATLDSAINGEADKVTVDYNATYGYPASANIDYVEMAIDDEMGIEVNEFEILN